MLGRTVKPRKRDHLEREIRRSDLARPPAANFPRVHLRLGVSGPRDTDTRARIYEALSLYDNRASAAEGGRNAATDIVGRVRLSRGG